MGKISPFFVCANGLSVSRETNKDACNKKVSRETNKKYDLTKVSRKTNSVYICGLNCLTKQAKSTKIFVNIKSYSKKRRKRNGKD